MSSTLLERTRSSHEEIERLQRYLIEEMKQTPKTHKDNVVQSHRVNKTIENIIAASKRLEQTYEDKDGSRKEEIASIGGQGPSLYSLFYDRLREIKEYHRRYPNVEVERPENLLVENVNVAFTGEEGYGQYLDLNDLFITFINLDQANRTDYLSYIQTFYQFDKLPERRLYSRKHREYVAALLVYLNSFLQRTQPLLNVEKELAPRLKEFEEKWKSGAFNPSTPAATRASEETKKDNGQAATPADATSATEAGNTNADANKKKKNRKRKNKKPAPDATSTTDGGVDPSKDDFNNPLYCRACAKLYSKDTVFRGHMSSKKHVDAAAETDKLRHEILLDEFKIERLGELLAEQINNTKASIEKRQSQSADERRKELEDQETGGQEEEEDEEEEEEPVRMTIENYPIGWDGKPIPYWLYKLHGLGIEYKCEICGNTSYFGRKAFEKHFQEWRHAHGMSCLGIPNTIHFQEVTKILDAQVLWAKIKADGQKVVWRPDADEEYEDVDGHVMSRKTFEDLRRQGLA